MLNFSHFLVHPSAADDAPLRARHASFVMGHLGGAAVTAALVALMVFCLESVPPALWAGAVWLVLSPIGIAALLRRTGKLELAQGASIANLGALVLLLTLLTGGLASPLLPWFVLVPFEAALSGRRRLIAGAVGISAVGVSLLAFLQIQGQIQGLAPVFALEAAGSAPLLQALGLVAAIAYAGVTAAASQSAHRTLTRLARIDESRYRLLAENAMDLILRFGQDGRITFASPSAYDVLGYGAAELTGQSISEFVFGDDRSNVQSALVRAVYFGGEAMLEFRIRSKDDTLLWVEMRCRPLLLDLKAEPDSAVLQWAAAEASGNESDSDQETRPAAAFETVAIMRDISDRKRAEGSLMQARDDAEAANRAKSRFLANMSHELRTPLNAIIGFSEMMMTELFGPLGNPRYTEYVKHIKDSGEHLRDLINDVLDMSKIEAGRFDLELEQVSIPLAIEDVLKTVSVTAKKRKVKLDVQLPDSLPRMTADRRAIKQVLLNILANAIKFTPERGTVTTAARVEGPHMVLEVRDTGVGIAADELKRLGRPFEQSASAKSTAEAGTGLGLALVKAFVDLHGGALSLASEEGVGTVVTISLPLEGPRDVIPGRDEDNAPINLADRRRVA